MFKYPNTLNTIFNKLKNNNIRPVFVGGFVRDYFLQKESKDIDIEVYNIDSYEKLQEILREFGDINIVGNNFGVLKLTFDNYEIDFSLPRIDNKTSKGHKGFEVIINPNLDFKTAASRRDFTINSIGYDVNSNKFIDPFNGIDDLKNKRLKIININTFVEDPLRVLRAMGFCARFELNCDEELILTCKTMIKQNMLDELPTQRIYSEFKKLFLKANKPSTGLEFLKKIGGLNFFYELKMDEDLWIYTLMSIDKFATNKPNNNSSNITIMLALLCYKIDKTKISSFIDKLTNKKKIKKDIFDLRHVATYLEQKDNILLYNIAKDISLDDLNLFLYAINIKNKTLKKFVRPFIHGKDILESGIKPSKEYGNILQTIYNEQLKDNNSFSKRTKKEIITKLV